MVEYNETSTQLEPDQIFCKKCTANASFSNTENRTAHGNNEFVLPHWSHGCAPQT